MSYRLVFGDLYESAVEEAFDWYREQSEIAALHLIDRIEEALQIIQQNPFIYQLQERNFR